jgi:hypothetical protein
VSHKPIYRYIKSECHINLFIDILVPEIRVSPTALCLNLMSMMLFHYSFVTVMTLTPYKDTKSHDLTLKSLGLTTL